jgi:hypothetical protein
VTMILGASQEIFQFSISINQASRQNKNLITIPSKT